MQEREFDKFTEGLFDGVKPTFHWRHPSQKIWRTYLEQEASRDAPRTPEELLSWSDSQLNLWHHLLTCGRCARQLARLRQEAQPVTWRWRLAWQFARLGPIGYGALATLLVTVGILYLLSHGPTIIINDRTPGIGDAVGGFGA